MASARVNNFDFLRLAAASAVFVSHTFSTTGRPPTWQPELGRVGVYIFFAISGYLVTQSWCGDPDALRFLKRRMLRIWPAYAVVVLLGACIIMPVFLTGATLHEELAYASNIVLLRYWAMNGFSGLPLGGLNDPLWTIPIEVRCYLALLLAGLLSGRWLKASMAALLVLCVGASLLNLDQPIFQLFDAFAPFFLAGALLALEPRLMASRSAAAGLVLLGIVAVLCGRTVVAYVLILPFVIIWIGKRQWPVIRRAGRFGDFSYGIYLYAWLSQQLTIVIVGLQRPLWLIAVVSAVLTLLCAAISWYAIERPALRLKPRSSAPV